MQMCRKVFKTKKNIVRKEVLKIHYYMVVGLCMSTHSIHIIYIAHTLSMYYTHSLMVS